MRRRELEQQIETLNTQVASLNKQVDMYRSQEQAIVQALTQAQSSAAKHVEEAKASAARIVSEAEEQAERTLQQAQEQKACLLEEAQTASSKANAQAAAIVEAAQAESSRRLAQTEAAVRDFNARLASLNAMMQDTASQARTRAQEFAATMDSLQEIIPEISEESRGLRAHIDESAGKLPEDYETPQELMHSIYQLQGRELPGDVEEAEDMEEIQPASDVPDMLEPTPIAQEPLPIVEEAEEHVWTVDEVMQQSADGATGDLEVDLDSLIDEIIGD